MTLSVLQVLRLLDPERHLFTDLDRQLICVDPRTKKTIRAALQQPLLQARSALDHRLHEALFAHAGNGSQV